MTDIKICGLSTQDTLACAIDAGASHVGFVFFPKSPRHVGFETAASLAVRVPGHVQRVGVFVDPDNELLDAAIRAGRLDVVQLHGREDAARIADVQRRFGVGVWRAASVATSADVEAAVAARGTADLLLFDAKAPNGSELPGGNGVRFDWRLLSGRSFGGRWGLSGGLDAGCVAEAVTVTGAPLVDVSSGVESAPGVKSADKIRAFCEAVRES